MYILCVLLIQEPEPVIRSQTVVLRRSSDGKKQENRDEEARQTLGDQQEIQDKPVIRSTTVLLKQSAEKDQQECKHKQENNLEPQESNSR